VSNETITVIERVEQSEKLAFKQRNAADILEISERTLRNEIARRKIFPTQTLRLISREELLRYLREETQLARRARGPYRTRKINGKNTATKVAAAAPNASAFPLQQNEFSNRSSHTLLELTGASDPVNKHRAI
jgi:hypothetical protein